jgi:hypothetical protein
LADQLIIELAARYNVPTIYPDLFFAESGGLIALCNARTRTNDMHAGEHIVSRRQTELVGEISAISRTPPRSPRATRDVRFTPESAHSPARSGCLLWATNGLMHRSKSPSRYGKHVDS